MFLWNIPEDYFCLEALNEDVWKILPRGPGNLKYKFKFKLKQRLEESSQIKMFNLKKSHTTLTLNL